MHPHYSLPHSDWILLLIQRNGFTQHMPWHRSVHIMTSETIHHSTKSKCLHMFAQEMLRHVVSAMLPAGGYDSSCQDRVTTCHWNYHVMTHAGVQVFACELVYTCDIVHYKLVSTSMCLFTHNRHAQSINITLLSEHYLKTEIGL